MSVINLSHLWQEHNEREHLLEGKWLLINISSAKMYLDVSQYFGEPFMLLPQMWSYYWFVLILPPWVFFFLKRQSQRVTQGWAELNLSFLSDLLIPLKCMFEWEKKYHFFRWLLCRNTAWKIQYVVQLLIPRPLNLLLAKGKETFLRLF